MIVDTLCNAQDGRVGVIVVCCCCLLLLLLSSNKRSNGIEHDGDAVKLNTAAPDAWEFWTRAKNSLE